jgi:hypothetical protein
MVDSFEYAPAAEAAKQLGDTPMRRITIKKVADNRLVAIFERTDRQEYAEIEVTPPPNEAMNVHGVARELRQQYNCPVRVRVPVRHGIRYFYWETEANVRHRRSRPSRTRRR